MSNSDDPLPSVPSTSDLPAESSVPDNSSVPGKSNVPDQSSAAAKPGLAVHRPSRVTAQPPAGTSATTPLSSQSLVPQTLHLSVLIVDDDDAMRSSIRRVLKLDGYRVSAESSGASMFSRDDLDEFFAILLDRKLPDGDASHLISDLRERAPHAAILIVTGHADMDSTLAAIRGGVDDYLIKPVEPDTLRSRLASLAELYAVRRELMASESRMRFLVENLPAGAIFVDHDALFMNRAVELMTGYQASEIGTVRDWFRVLCADRFQECLDRYRAIQAAGFKQACVLPVVRKDGIRRELRMAAHRYDHHEVWLVTDVTELQDAERRMVQAERLAAIGQMVTGLAHESRNALQRARGCLDLLELDLENQTEQLNLTARIRRALGDLQRNYEEVRQYAAPISLDRSTVELGQVIQTALDDLVAANDYRDVHLKVERRGCGQICVDEHRMGQLFRNILENAIAASDGSTRIEAIVSRTSEVGEDWLRCDVTDFGKGMDQETQARVFEPFYTTKQSGTGLGMAICKRIIEAHRGRIQVTSESQSGTTIRIDLPVDPP